MSSGKEQIRARLREPAPAGRLDAWPRFIANCRRPEPDARIDAAVLCDGAARAQSGRSSPRHCTSPARRRARWLPALGAAARACARCWCRPACRSADAGVKARVIKLGTAAAERDDRDPVREVTTPLAINTIAAAGIATRRRQHPWRRRPLPRAANARRAAQGSLNRRHRGNARTSCQRRNAGRRRRSAHLPFRQIALMSTRRD